MVDVFLAKPPKDDAEEDTADRLAVLRAPFESAAWVTGEDGRRPAGPGALVNLKSSPEFLALAQAATTAEPLRPALTSPLVEGWAMTSLPEHPGRPRVEPWLRGWVETVPQTRVVWRRVLPVREGKVDCALLNEFFAALPPHASEQLETETFRVAGMLKKRSGAVSEKRGDGAERVRSELGVLTAVTLGKRGELEDVFPLEGLVKSKTEWLEGRLAGRTVVLDARLGGLDGEGLLDPRAEQVPTTLDAEVRPTGRAGWDEVKLMQVGRRLRTVASDADALSGWIREAGWPVVDDDDAAVEWRIERLERAPELGDSARSAVQELASHHEWVAAEAGRIAAALGLSETHRSMLVSVANLHDAGKDRAAWQDAMGARRDAGRPYAKTDGRKSNPALLKVGEWTYRHEFGSLRDAGAVLGELDDDTLNLALHLIAAHHGLARPLIAPADPAEPPSQSAERAREVALRFATLQRVWGPWGLAWWEALLRAADWAASRRLTDRQTG